MTFMDLFKDVPGFTDFVAGMPAVWPISMLQDIYAPFGALHLVGLGLMGGAVLLLNLRLMGTNLTNQTLPDVERSTRPWLIAGLAIVLGTVAASDHLDPWLAAALPLLSLAALLLLRWRAQPST